MGKARLILTILFILTLSSGLVAGMLVSRMPNHTPTTTPIDPRSPLAEALKLTDQQNEQMRKIWEGVRNHVDEAFAKSQEIQKHRDEAVMKLLSDDQKKAYAALQQECSDALNTLRNERDTAFQTAVTETKKILTDEQKDKYEKILERRLGRGPVGAPDWIPAK